jgi:hypothetical protein
MDFDTVDNYFIWIQKGTVNAAALNLGNKVIVIDVMRKREHAGNRWIFDQAIGFIRSNLEEWFTPHEIAHDPECPEYYSAGKKAGTGEDTVFYEVGRNHEYDNIMKRGTIIV